MIAIGCDHGALELKEQLVDLLALLQAGQCAVLPQNGGGIAGGAHQALMAGLQCLVAESQALVKDLPELLEVAAGGKGYIHQIDGDNTLIEAAVVFGLAGLGVHIGSQEAAAAHAGVAVALAVFVHLQFGSASGVKLGYFRKDSERIFRVYTALYRKA